MKITIDEKVCLKHKMTVPEVLMALAVRSGIDGNQIHNMLNREILIEEQSNSWYMVTQHWSDVLDEILADSSETPGIDDERLLNLAKQMRELYPKGKMKDRFGHDTPYYFRCNNSEVVKALKRFITQKGNYTDEEILDATKRYVAANSRNNNFSGMRLIKYFILKDERKEDEEGNIRVIQSSDLETYLSNKESEEEEGVVINNSDEWLMNMRN